MSEFLSVFLPIAMMVLMLSLGLRLDPREVSASVRHPRALATGLVVQLVGLPLIAFAVAMAFGTAPALAAGLLLVAASPGGVTSNYATLLARGSVGLSISMTMVTSLVAPISLPLVLAAAHVATPQGVGGLWKISLAMTAVALVPLALGVLAARVRPGGMARLSKGLDPVAKVLFLAMVLGTFWQNWGAMGEAFAGVGAAVTLFAVLAPVLAFAAARVVRIGWPETRAVMIEASMQNVAITIFVATTLLGNAGLAIPGLIYAIEMNIVALAIIGLAHLRRVRQRARA